MTSDREWSGENSDIPISSLQNSEKTCACSSKLFNMWYFFYGSLEKFFRTGVAEVRALAARSEAWIHFTVPTWKLLSVSNLTLSHKRAGNIYEIKRVLPLLWKTWVCYQAVTWQFINSQNPSCKGMTLSPDLCRHQAHNEVYIHKCKQSSHMHKVIKINLKN